MTTPYQLGAQIALLEKLAQVSVQQGNIKVDLNLTRSVINGIFRGLFQGTGGVILGSLGGTLLGMLLSPLVKEQISNDALNKLLRNVEIGTAGAAGLYLGSKGFNSGVNNSVKAQIKEQTMPETQSSLIHDIAPLAAAYLISHKSQAAH